MASSEATEIVSALIEAEHSGAMRCRRRRVSHLKNDAAVPPSHQHQNQHQGGVRQVDTSCW